MSVFARPVSWRTRARPRARDYIYARMYPLCIHTCLAREARGPDPPGELYEKEERGDVVEREGYSRIGPSGRRRQREGRDAAPGLRKVQEDPDRGERTPEEEGHWDARNESLLVVAMGLSDSRPDRRGM